MSSNGGTESTVTLLGVGSYLPAKVKVADRIRAAGGIFEEENYEGWSTVCTCSEQEHPATMAHSAVQRALDMAGLDAGELDLVISVGATRDYNAPWSLATEVMNLLQTPTTTVGLDLQCGCAAVLTGLDVAEGWLRTAGKKYAAIVCAERWAHDVDLTDENSRQLWQFSDGAAALILGQNVDGKSFALYRGLAVRSHAAFNGLAMQHFGGTRNPHSETFQNPYVISSKLAPSAKVAYIYQKRLRDSIGALLDKNKLDQVDSVVATQLTPTFVAMMRNLGPLRKAHCVELGHEVGHLGGADVFVGLQRLIRDDRMGGNTLMIAVSPYLFAAALVSA